MALQITSASCVSLLALLITSGCGKSAPKPEIVDVSPPTNSSAPAPPAPVRTSEAVVALPVQRDRLSGPAREVVERGGALFARDKDGKEEQLTPPGLDSAPHLSPDGRTVVFRRRRSADEPFPTDIYLARVGGDGAELLVREDPTVEVEGYELWCVCAPEFSVDGKRVFFGIVSGRYNVVLAIDLATRKMSVITGGWDHRIIRRGPHAGQILLLKKNYDDPRAHGWVPACSIVDSVHGKLVRAIDCMDTLAQLGVEVL